MNHTRTLALALCTTLLATHAATATPVRLGIDRNHSTVGFKVPILGGLSTVTGKFTDFEIEIDYDPDDPGASSVSATIRAASIDTGIDARDEHLRTDDFFAAESHPTITFRSDSVRFDGMEGEATGTLTLRGVSRPVTLQLRRSGVDGRSVGFTASATFDRTDFGVSWQHGDVPLFVGNEVTAEFFVLASMPRDGGN